MSILLILSMVVILVVYYLSVKKIIRLHPIIKIIFYIIASPFFLLIIFDSICRDIITSHPIDLQVVFNAIIASFFLFIL